MRPHIILISALLIPGCSYDQYTLVLVPDGESLQRTLSVTHVNPEKNNKQSPVSVEVQMRISKYYNDHATVAEPWAMRFSGRFAGTQPGDVGGRGEYSRWESSLGNYSFYRERFRGNDDLNGQLEDVQAKADRAVDLMMRWLSTALGKHKGFKKLQKFLDRQFRNDLKNVGLYLWLGSSARKTAPRNEGEPLVRIFHYLQERDYWQKDELALLVTGATFGTSARQKKVLEYVRSQLAKRMGISKQDAPRALAPFDTMAKIEASLNAFLQQSPEYQALVAEWERRGPDKRGKKPLPVKVWENVWEDFIELVFIDTNDRLKIQLAVSAEPIATNGTWARKKNQVTWDSRIVEDRSLPTFRYAIWAEPAAAFQVKHFGKVVLKGEQLGEFVLWWSGLPAQAGQELAEFLRALQPNDKLITRLNEFKFITAEGKPHQPAADTLLKSIIESLQGPENLREL